MASTKTRAAAGDKPLSREFLTKPLRNDAFRIMGVKFRQGVCYPVAGRHKRLVDVMGLEPTTPWLQTRCSPS